MPSGGSTPISENAVDLMWRQLVDAARDDRFLYKYLQLMCKDRFVAQLQLEYVRREMLNAICWGMRTEWAMYFFGGMLNDNKEPWEAARDAAIEWDL